MSEEQQPKTLETALDGMPWWVKATMFFANTLGFPVLMVMYLLAQDAGAIKNPVAERTESLDRQLQELTGVTIQHNASMKELIEVMQEDSRSRQLHCVLRAKTEADKKACFPTKE